MLRQSRAAALGRLEPSVMQQILAQRPTLETLELQDDNVTLLLAPLPAQCQVEFYCSQLQIWLIGESQIYQPIHFD